MFNAENEMFGYDKAETVLRENALLTAPEIINRFAAAAKDWAGARPADDDVTFVVIKSV